MRFITMHNHDARTEAGEPPPMSLVQEMGALIGELASTGHFLGGEGLGASRTRTRLTFRDGHATVKHGPYAGERELPSEILAITAPSRDAAIGWAERYGKLLGDGEIEVAACNEPWDIGLAPRPDNPPLRFLMIVKADADTEAGRPRAQKAAITRLRTEMTKAGVLVDTKPLAPSAQGKRIVFENHAMRMVDGPFSESKELIGGFAVVEFDGWDDVIAMTQRYAKILGGTLTIDVRLLADES